MSAEEIEATHQERVEAAVRRDLRRHLCCADHETLPEDAPTALALFLQLQGRIG